MSRLRRYELQGCADQTFETLSGGQQARFQVLLLELDGATLAAARRAHRQPRPRVSRGARGRTRRVRGHRHRGDPRPLVHARLRPIPRLRRRLQGHRPPRTPHRGVRHALSCQVAAATGSDSTTGASATASTASAAITAPIPMSCTPLTDSPRNTAAPNRREHGLAEHEHRRRRDVDVCVRPRHEAMARGAGDEHEQHQPQPADPVHRPEVLAGEQCDRCDGERGDERHRGEVLERSDAHSERAWSRGRTRPTRRGSATASRSPAVERFPLDPPASTTTTTPAMASAEQTIALASDLLPHPLHRDRERRSRE